jgi:tryptophan synthase alpha chain
MSNRMDEMFKVKAALGKKALITFTTAGDPDLAMTQRLVLEMEKAGADLVELGVPYSDPIAEGPVIQAANVRALKNDVRMDTLFCMIERLREQTQIPLVYLIYLNSILQYGKEAFFHRCREAGVDGVIVPDLPYEESEELSSTAKAEDVRLIRLVAPTSEGRIAQIAAQAEGFLYCVSSLGVTGTRAQFNTDFDKYFDSINHVKKTPTALGFGISSPEQVKELRGYADAIIVASAIVKRMAEAASPDEAVSAVSTFVKELRDALDSEYN